MHSRALAWIFAAAVVCATTAARGQDGDGQEADAPLAASSPATAVAPAVAPRPQQNSNPPALVSPLAISTTTARSWVPTQTASITSACRGVRAARKLYRPVSCSSSDGRNGTTQIRYRRSTPPFAGSSNHTRNRSTAAMPALLSAALMPLRTRRSRRSSSYREASASSTSPTNARLTPITK